MITIFTNIPNPYNGYLYQALRDRDVPLKVIYKGDPRSENRLWQLPLPPHDATAGTLRTEFRHLRADAPGSATILSGGYAGSVEFCRRLVAPRCASSVWFWGERLRYQPWLDRYRRWYFKPCNGILAIGAWAIPSYQALVESTPVHVLPYTTSVRCEPRLLADEPVIGFAGSLIKRKGLDILFHGVAALPAGQRPRLEVVGSGPLRQALEALAHDLKLRVEWIGELGAEAVDHRRSRWWAQAVPSRYDGWGVVVSEAMASGVPAITASEVGAGRDLVRDGFNGVRVRTDAGWPDAIRRYCDRKTVEADGRRARIVGEELSSVQAAAWLVEVVGAGSTGPQRDFVTEGWARVEARGI